MRHRYPEYYLPGPDGERRFIVEGTVVVDANVLLGLYRLTAVQREEVLDVLATIADRLWIPYQVGLEYQRGRMGVIRAQAAHYASLVGLHGAKSAEELADALAKVAVPDAVADEVKPLLADLAARLAGAANDYVHAVEAIRDRHVVSPDRALLDDPVRARLDEIVGDRVGERPNDSTRQDRIKEAERRAESHIPPGYKDDNKGTPERRAGDYLLWAEILDYAANSVVEGRPFLLVTNDTKEDWYERSGGQVVGPRSELVREFASRSRSDYHQVTLEGLLRLANQHLSASVDDDTIVKASELSEVPDAVSTDWARLNALLANSAPWRRDVDDALLWLINARNPDYADATWRFLNDVNVSEAAKSNMLEALRQRFNNMGEYEVLRRVLAEWAQPGHQPARQYDVAEEHEGDEDEPRP